MSKTLEPNAEYVVHDIYLASIYKKASLRQRGDLRIRTDAEGRAWIKGIGRPEFSWFTRWCAEHPRLERVN